ncbi:hypothetical protein EXIGLDRAFT_588765, partial [Exidia glandulosa HHB12029]
CAVCGWDTTSWCSRCENRFYCSPEHLCQDWPKHRLTCKPVGESQTQPIHAQPPLQEPHPISTPTLYLPAAPTTTVNAVLFPRHADNPCIILVPCCPPTSPTVSACPEPVIGEYLPITGGIRPVSGILKHDHENNIERRYPLQVWYCPGADTVNQSILRMTSGQASHAIAGDVLIMKFASKDCSDYIDANFDDLPAVLHLF